MAVLEPGDGDDSVLAAMAAQLEGIEAPTDVENVQDLPAPKLTQQLQDIDRTLSKWGELMSPRTEQGRELHSKRVALLVELSRRGLR